MVATVDLLQGNVTKAWTAKDCAALAFRRRRFPESWMNLLVAFRRVRSLAQTFGSRYPPITSPSGRTQEAVVRNRTLRQVSATIGRSSRRTDSTRSHRRLSGVVGSGEGPYMSLPGARASFYPVWTYFVGPPRLPSDRDITFIERVKHDRVFHQNTLIYSILHEISHILSPSIRHEPPFDSIESTLLKKGFDLGYYDPNVQIESHYMTLDLIH